ncbi:MAG: insulinase family protein [Spongiibacteraceae bacterium]
MSMSRPASVRLVVVKNWQQRLVFFLLALIVLAGCTLPPAAPPQDRQLAPVEVITGPADQRAFRYVELPNHLRVLLISDPTADKAAAALDVNVGSRQDPAARPGLAHFLEHMLFLGTERYPEAGEYQNYISAHGGSHNAFTAFEHTNYFFDIDARHLEAALDRFSQFFVAPLFTAQYVDREKHAVHSEYRANINDDGRRGFDVLKAVTNPEHPFALFSVGSLETLADNDQQPVREDLLKFYREHYSANLMSLVVIGREPLDQLQAMVQSRFAAVPDRRAATAAIQVPLFKPEQLPALVQVQPVQQQRSLSFMWPIPDQSDDYRSKSLEYIGNIVGHEGEGSLLSWLKTKGWAQALGAGEGIDYDGGSSFNVSIELTEAGAAHVDEIAAAVFQTLARIGSDGIQPWLFHEQQVVAEQRFRYRDRANPIDEASRLALNLQKYPPAEVLRGPMLMETFKPERVRTLLAQLTPQNLLLTLTAPGVKTDRISPWYQVPYSEQKISAAQIEGWLAGAAADSRQAGAIRIPEPNIFVAEHLDLKTAAGAQLKPVLLQKSPTLQLWYAPDNVFRLPKATVALSVRSPVATDTPEHLVLTELLARMVGENLNEFSYPAALAGLRYDIERNGRGINVSVQGFDEKQAVLLEHILKALRDPKLERSQFERVRREYQRELEDEEKRTPYQLLVDDLGDVLQRQRWPESTLIKFAAKADVKQLEIFARQWLVAGEAKLLVYGNYTEADARQLGTLVTTALLADMRPVPSPVVEVLRLPSTEMRRDLRIKHDDAGLLWYRQAGDNSRKTRAALGVSAQILASDFYTRLRTQQQLGYIVMSTPYPVRDVPGLVFLVQSPVAGTQKLAAAYREFLQVWAAQDETALRKMFDAHRAALANRLAEAPKNQGEQFERYWQDLANADITFDTREQLLAEVQRLSFEDWLVLFRRDVLAPEGHALWLAIDGKFGDDTLRAGKDVGDLDRFKARQTFYRFP